MWENNEGDIIFLYAMKLVPPSDLESTIHLGIVHPKYYLLQHYHSTFTTLGTY